MARGRSIFRRRYGRLGAASSSVPPQTLVKWAFCALTLVGVLLVFTQIGPDATQHSRVHRTRQGGRDRGPVPVNERRAPGVGTFHAVGAQDLLVLG